MAYITHQDRQLHYVEQGQGPVVILLHGLGSHSKDWSLQLSALAANYRVIAPDFRGHGQSSPSSTSFSIQDLARDIKALVTTLALKEFHLVGFSLGGMVAFSLAGMLPSKVCSLVIINSAPQVANSRWQLKFQLALRLIIIRCLGMQRLGVIIGKKLFDSETQAHLADAFAKQMARTDAATYRQTLTAISQFSLGFSLSCITMPVLVVSADNDYTSIAVKQAYTEQLPNAQLVIIENSKHATPLDQPHLLNQQLLNFLQNNSGSNSSMQTAVNNDNNGDADEHTNPFNQAQP